MMRAMPGRRALLTIAACLSVGFAARAEPVSAMSCRDWLRLDPAQKEAAIDEMISDLVGSQRVRQYGVNRGALGRCLYAAVPDMAIDFDDICSDSRTAGRQAIQNRFKNYVWSCD
jgi:hypothetical protein